MTNEDVDDDFVEIYCFPLTNVLRLQVVFPFRAWRRIFVMLHGMKAKSLIDYTGAKVWIDNPETTV